MILPVTSVTALILGAWLLLLTFRVVRFRRRDGVVMGDNGDRVLAKAIRGHANAAEQIPIALILMALAEMNGAAPWLLAALALVLVAGRLAHGAYFGWHGLTWRLRFWGMLATATAQGGLLIALALALLT